MEKMIATLLENTCKMSKEAFKNLFNIVLLTTVDQIKYKLTCTESIGPFFHFKSAFKLILSHIKQFRCAVIVFQCYWVGNLVVSKFWLLCCFKDVLEV